MGRVVSVGYSKRLVDGWESLVPPPKAPSNWKDPEKIAAYEKEAMSKLADQALGYAIAATPNEIIAVDGAEVTKLDADSALEYLSTYFIINGIGIFDLLNVLFFHTCAIGKMDHNFYWAKFSPVLRSNYLADKGNLRVVVDPLETLTGSSDPAVAPALVTRLKLTGLKFDTATDRAIASRILAEFLKL